jgi:hypothetical protein
MARATPAEKGPDNFGGSVDGPSRIFFPYPIGGTFENTNKRINA